MLGSIWIVVLGKVGDVRGLILFDIDGTLLKPGDPAHQQALIESVRQMFQVDASLEGVPLGGMLDSQIVRIALERHGVPAEEVGGRLNELMLAMTERYRELLDGEERTSWLLPGILDLLPRLQGEFLLSVLTGNASGVARAKLEAAGIVDHFPFGAYGDSAEHRYELVSVAAQKAAERHGMTWEPRQLVIVGDTPRDIEAARASGVSVAAVATGRYSVDDLAEHEPDALFEDLADVVEVHAALRRIVENGE